MCPLVVTQQYKHHISLQLRCGLYMDTLTATICRHTAVFAFTFLCFAWWVSAALGGNFAVFIRCYTYMLYLYVVARGFTEQFTVICFYYARVSPLLNVGCNFIYFLVILDNTEKYTTLSWAPKSAYPSKHTSMAAKCRIFVLQILRLGSYRYMMLRFLHWHPLVMPNQLCLFLLKRYLAAVERNMEISFTHLFP